jgi:putative membrane protein
MLRRILLRLIINAIALWAAIELVPGISADRPLTILIVALIFGVVNALIRPIVAFFTCPMIILTLGLFIFVVNALMLLLTAWVAGQFDLGFTVDGFWPAFWGALVISLISFGISLLVKDEDREKKRDRR